MLFPFAGEELGLQWGAEVEAGVGLGLLHWDLLAAERLLARCCWSLLGVNEQQSLGLPLWVLAGPSL